MIGQEKATDVRHGDDDGWIDLRRPVVLARGGPASGGREAEAVVGRGVVGDREALASEMSGGGNGRPMDPRRPVVLASRGPAVSGWRERADIPDHGARRDREATALGRPGGGLHLPARREGLR